MIFDGEHAKTFISRMWVPAVLFLTLLAALTFGSGGIQNLTEDALGYTGTFITYSEGNYLLFDWRHVKVRSTR
jgi:hypothetical protein